jgi:hypothetical protein
VAGPSASSGGTEIDLQAVFTQFTNLEQRYLPGAPAEHDILLILENALIGGELMLLKDLTGSCDHLRLLRNALRIAYQVGKSEAEA